MMEPPGELEEKGLPQARSGLGWSWKELQGLGNSLLPVVLLSSLL